MAKLLVRAKDNFHPDPEVDFRACYKRGDIVVVVEDDHVFGRLEGPPDFEVVSVPGSASQWRHLREHEPLPPAARMPRVHFRSRRRLLAAIRNPDSPVGQPEMRRRRKWAVNLDSADMPIVRKPIQGV